MKNEMSDPKDEIIKALATGGMLAVLTGIAKALREKRASLLQRIKILFIAITIGLVATILVIQLHDVSEFKKGVIIVVATAFGQNLWPEVEARLFKWFKKADKITDIIEDKK